MNSRPYTIGLLTVLFLVALRVAVGWHFFAEGLSHKNDPNWSSAGFLRQAKGPLAEHVGEHVPGLHGFDRLVIVPLSPDGKPAAKDPVAKQGNVGAGVEAPQPDGAKSAPNGDINQATAKPASNEDARGAPNVRADAALKQPKPADSNAFGDWYKAVVTDWDALQKQMATHYGFNDEQRKQSDAVVQQYEKQLAYLLEGDRATRGIGEDIEAYRYQLQRNRQLAEQPGAADIPFWQKRLTRREGNPTAEPGISASLATGPAEWRAEVAALDAALERDLLALRTDEQRKRGLMTLEPTDLKKIDTVVPWVLIIGGGCLLVGLFTRLSALVLALFLGSVIALQPPWVAGTTPTYNQIVECIALLVLATSHVGRWGGLDFFIHHLLLRPFRSGRS